MADTTKNYNIKINTEISGEGSVKALGDTVDNAGEKFKRLQLQIKEMKTAMQAAQDAGDTVTFKKLKKELDDLEDKFEVIQKQTMQWDDQLQAMPGVLGNVGNGVKGLDGAFKMLKANPLLAIIGVVAGIFMAIYEALKKTQEGTAALNKVTEAFDKILTPIINFISAAAVPVVEAFANGVEWLGKAIGLVDDKQQKHKETLNASVKSMQELKNEYFEQIKNLREYDKKIIEVRNSEKLSKQQKDEWIAKLKEERGEVIKNVNEYAKAIREKEKSAGYELAADLKIKASAKNGRDLELAELKAQYDEKKRLLKNDIKNKEELNTALKNLDIVYNKEVSSINDKYTQQRKQEQKSRDQERLAKEKAANEVLYQSELVFLNDQQKELKNLEKKYQQDIITLKLAGFKDGSEQILLLTASYNQQINDVNEKYRKQDADNAKKVFEEALKQTQEKIQKFKDEATKSKQDWLNEYTAMANNTSLSLNERLAAIDESTTREIELFKEANGVNAENYLKFQNQISAIQQAGKDKRLQLIAEEKSVIYEQYAAYGDIAQSFGKLMQTVAEMGDESLEKTKGIAIAGIIIEKAGAIAQIVANTAIANAKAAAAFPLTGGLPWTVINTISAGISIASTVAEAVKSIQQINGAKSSSNSGAGGGASLPTYPSAPTVAAPQVNVSQQNTVGQDIASTLKYSKSVQKVYVTSNDVTSQQALDRRVKNNATF